MNNSGFTVIDASAVLFSNLFHKGRFTVPWHQRSYDWKVDDVRALLHDIDEAIKEEKRCYFLGAIMLIDIENNVWEINDGQQRMITMSLMCASLCRRFTNEMRGSQREGHALRILFDIDINRTCTLDEADHYTPRITPPQNYAMPYRQIIRGNTIGTNGTLTSAWREIDKFFDSMSERELDNYFDFVIQKIEVACLSIPRNIDANAVYETLNNRGKKLDHFDLIRNYIYSYFNTIKDNQRKSMIHENLDRIRIVIRSVQKASQYMRCHLQCIFGFLSKDHLYRDTKKAIINSLDTVSSSSSSFLATDYIFNLTHKITAPESLRLFQIITAPTPDPEFIHAFEIDSRTTNSRRNIAIILGELRAYTVSQPLVFALLTRYIIETDGRRKKRIARIVYKNLKRLSAFILRTAFVAPKFEPSHFETQFSNYAQSIFAQSDIPNEEFIDFLKDCDRSEYEVLDDSNFYNIMLESKMTTQGPRLKIFLFGINSALQPNVQLLHQRGWTVEHILPRASQHWDNWTEFQHDDRRDWIDRLGNLTLLGPSDNKPGPIFNGNFANKRQIFADSEFALTRELIEYPNWSSDTIRERQKRMAELAVQVWSFE